MPDEGPTRPPYQRTVTLVPPYTSAALQAVTVHPAADPPLILSRGQLGAAGAPPDPDLKPALDLLNAGEVEAARHAFAALCAPALRAAKAAGLFWVAGYPAILG